MQTGMGKKEKVTSLSVQPSGDPGIVMRWDDVEKFLAAFQAKGRDPDTAKAYRRALARFYNMLPLGKRVYQGTLAEWQNELLSDGYSNSSVNSLITACNQFLLRQTGVSAGWAVI